MIILLLAGLGAGLLGSCLGVGGGIILVPVLTIITGSPHQAIGTSLVAIIGVHGSSTLFHLREGWVDMRVAFILGPATVLGATVGALAAGFMSAPVLGILFACAAVYVAITMFLPMGEKGDPDRGAAVKLGKKAMGISLCGLSGIVSGMLGIGGGVMNVPVMRMVMGVPTKRAIATSSFLTGTTAVTGAIIYLMRGDVVILSIPPIVTGIVIGALVGTRIARWARPRWLRIAFGILLLYTAFQMLWEIFT